MKHALAEVAAVHSAHLPLQVTQAVESDRGRWDAFVRTCPEATFFHRFGWKPLIERVFGHRTFFLIAERGGAIEGVMPVVQIKSLLFGHGLASLPFGVYGGPAAVSEDAACALMDAAVKLAGKLGAAHLELRNRAARNPQWPRQDLYVTFRREIFPDEEANMLAIPRKQRAMVRKGINARLRSEIDTDTERLFQLYADNVHRHGTPPFPRRYFSALKEEFGEDAEALIVVDRHGVPLSGVLSFYFRDEVLPYYAGDDPRARGVAANDFKYWELMRRACARGLRVFDYGRSKRGTGSFDFKKNWGFQPRPLHYEYWLASGDHIPQNNPSNPKYKAFIALWRRLPRPVANALGPYLSRHLG